jgi:phage tail-like protein
VVVVGQGSRSQTLQLIGHDMAASPDGETIYIVERDGNQAAALRLDESGPGVEISREYLPLHTAGGRALVTGANGVYYDVSGNAPTNDGVVRWVKLQPVSRPYYARSAMLYVGQPGTMSSPAGIGLAESPVFDGKERDCVWHRLLLDACIPAEAVIRVWSRAHNRRDLLESLPFRQEPTLYLRGDGAELPFYNPYPEKETLPPGAGTWELLFQEAQGRYMQLKIELAGNGRVTPQVRAMRAYYPRFSYPRRFMPAVYVDESQPGPFLERLLANMEGFYTEIEGKMRDVSILFDPRSAPPEALDWLAGWMGLLLDPLWARLQAERQDHTPGWSRTPDRRRLFIRFARKLYERRGTADGIRFALELLLEPCLEVMLERLKAAAVGQDSFVRAELLGYGLTPPTATSEEIELEDLLYEWVLRRPSRVRLVESFLIRRGLGVVSGDPNVEEYAPSETAAGYAHQFTVLIPMELAPEEEAMVRRVINLEKPAHTVFSLRRYWEGFRISEARLGIDTTLDQTNRFVAMLLGRDYLSAGYMDADHPMNVFNRLISDRDRLGKMPPM